MKKTFLFLVAVMMAVCSELQATITPTSSQMWWGYYTAGDGSSLDYNNDGLGYSHPLSMLPFMFPLPILSLAAAVSRPYVSG